MVCLVLIKLALTVWTSSFKGLMQRIKDWTPTERTISALKAPGSFTHAQNLHFPERKAGPCGHTPFLFPAFLVSSGGLIGYFSQRLGEPLVIGGMRLDGVAASLSEASLDWPKCCGEVAKHSRPEVA